MAEPSGTERGVSASDTMRAIEAGAQSNPSTSPLSVGDHANRDRLSLPSRLESWPVLRSAARHPRRTEAAFADVGRRVRNLLRAAD